MNQNPLKTYIGQRSCELLGLGVSNLPLARLLTDMGCRLTVRDKKSIEELGSKASSLAARGVEFVTGEHCFEHLTGELIFRSPGIRPDLPALLDAVRGGAELTSEIELFLKLNSAMTFGITGSDGKTTSTTLTGKFLETFAESRSDGKVFVGGNIGEPLLNRLHQIGKDDRVVMELSSFQLMNASHSPVCAAITNLSPNHLDWHGNMQEYIAAKKRIIGKHTQRLVTNADNPTTAELAREILDGKSEFRPNLYLFSSSKQSYAEIFPNGAAEGDRALYIKDGRIVSDDGRHVKALLDTARIRIPGRHNLENFMTAIGLTESYVEPEVYGTVADRFCGVEHRLELVRTLDGVDYFNSSIDSSPTRTAAALSALGGRDIVIICGGYDKKIPFEPLAEALCRSVRTAVLTGATAGKIEEAIAACPHERAKSLCIIKEPNFADAVRAAKEAARRGGCVLLSPACASFDAFRNFAERGETFRQIVKNF